MISVFARLRAPMVSCLRNRSAPRPSRAVKPTGAQLVFDGDGDIMLSARILDPSGIYDEDSGGALRPCSLTGIRCIVTMTVFRYMETVTVCRCTGAVECRYIYTNT